MVQPQLQMCSARSKRPAGPGLRSSLVKAAARTMAWQEALQMAEVGEIVDGFAMSIILT